MTSPIGAAACSGPPPACTEAVMRVARSGASRGISSLKLTERVSPGAILPIGSVLPSNTASSPCSRASARHAGAAPRLVAVTVSTAASPARTTPVGPASLTSSAALPGAAAGDQRGVAALLLAGLDAGDHRSRLLQQIAARRRGRGCGQLGGQDDRQIIGDRNVIRIGGGGRGRGRLRREVELQHRPVGAGRRL